MLSTGCKTCWKCTTVFRLFMTFTSHFLMLFLHLYWVGEAVHALWAEMNFWGQLPNGQEVPNCLGHWCPLPALQFIATISLISYFFSLVPLPLLQLLEPFFLFLLPSGSCRIYSSLLFPRKWCRLIFLLQSSHLVCSFHVLEDALAHGCGENIREWTKSCTPREIRLCYHWVV